MMTNDSDSSTPGATADARPPDQPPAHEERVSVVTGHRTCAQCGYRLVGQPVVREPRYGLLVIRCAECGTVAAVHEYPVLGPWARRWSAILSLVGFVAIMGLMSVLIPISIMTAGFTVEATESYDWWLRDQHRDWVATMHPDQDTSQHWLFEDFEAYWATQDHAAVLQSAGGWTRFIEWDELALLFVPFGMALLAGGMLSLAMLQRSRRFLLVIAAVVGVLATAIITVVWITIAQLPQVSSESVALQQFMMPAVAIAAFFVWSALIAGLMFGRPAGRLLVCALLPPRLRIPLSFLWTSEGLDVPKGKR